MGEDKNLINMFDALMAQEEEAKAIKTGVNETLEMYAQNHEKDKKSVKELYKRYKEYRKDPEKFVLIDYEVDAMLNAIIPEYSTKEEV